MERDISGRLPLAVRRRLQIVQIGDRALSVRSRREDKPLLIRQHFEPGCEITRMIGARLELWDNTEIGAEETCPKVGNQFLTRAIAAILVVAAEVPV